MSNSQPEEILDLDEIINSTMTRQARPAASQNSLNLAEISQILRKNNSDIIDLTTDQQNSVTRHARLPRRIPSNDHDIDRVISEHNRPGLSQNDHNNNRIVFEHNRPRHCQNDHINRFISEHNRQKHSQNKAQFMPNSVSNLLRQTVRSESRSMTELIEWKNRLHCVPSKRDGEVHEEVLQKKKKTEETKNEINKQHNFSSFSVTDFVKKQEEEERKNELLKKEIAEKNSKEKEYREKMREALTEFKTVESEESRLKREFQIRESQKNCTDDFFNYLLGIQIGAKKSGMKTKTIQTKFKDGGEYINNFQTPFFQEVFAEVTSAIKQRDMSDYSEIELHFFEQKNDFILFSFSEDLKDPKFSSQIHSEDLVILFSANLPDEKFKKSFEDWPSVDFYTLSFIEKYKDNKLKLKVRQSDYSNLEDSRFRAKAIVIETCTTMLREFKMIRISEFNSLTPYLYSPTKLPIVVKRHTLDSFLPILEKFHNEPQIDAILNCCCVREGISLIQGPPGTGKTHTIRGILSILMSQLDKGKILVCAPSNTAVDEIANRVILEKLYGVNGQGIQGVNLLRIGNQKRSFDMRDLRKDLRETPKAVLDITLSKKVKDYLNMTDITIETEEFKQTKKELETLRSLLERYKKNNNKAKVVELQEQISKKQNILFSEKKSNKDKKGSLLLAEKKIITNSNIIFTTLSGSGSKDLDGLENQIEFVIIDEACQATELSSLIPFRLNPRAVFLIGDPKQLPATTFSVRSQKNFYNRSLFERLMSGGCKVDLLKVQYRMTEEICRFPSSQFYNSQLTTFDEGEARKGPDWLKSTGVYFFDLESSQESRSNSETSLYNTSECNFIEDIFAHFQDLHGKKLNIGIISPYKKQMQFIKERLGKINDDWKTDIEVNTVDGFQGREKDVIVFSTVRSEESIGFLADARRLNVAITRAKFALWIIGSSKCLTRNYDWKQLVEYCEANKKLKKCKRFSEVLELFTPDNILETFRQKQNEPFVKRKDWGERKNDRKEPRKSRSEKSEEGDKAGRSRESRNSGNRRFKKEGVKEREKSENFRFKGQNYRR